MKYEYMEETGTLIQWQCQIGQTVYEIQELRKINHLKLLEYILD